MPTALLIIDVQTALCAGKWAAFNVENVVDRINATSAKARAAKLPVFLIQHEDDSLLQYGSENWSLYATLQTKPNDIRLRKTATDSFHKTDLQAKLQALAVTDLIICGLQSDFCVDTTTRRALALGYPVQLIADGHSTCDNGLLSAAQISAHHALTLSNIESFGPRVTTPVADALRFVS